MKSEKGKKTTTVVTEEEVPDPGNPSIERTPGVQVGGPGGEFSYRLGDREFKSPEELTEFLGGLNTEIQDLKKKVEAKPAVVKQEAPKEPEAPKVPAAAVDPLEEAFKDIDTSLAITDPKKFASLVAGTAVKIATSNLTSAYQAQRNLENWWTSFYDQNPEFKDHKKFVGMVFQDHYNELSPLKME